jgi:hypothetical protein
MQELLVDFITSLDGYVRARALRWIWEACTNHAAPGQAVRVSLRKWGPATTDTTWVRLINLTRQSAEARS